MSSKVKDRDKVDLKDDLDEKLERHKLWANLILLRNGRTCFGCKVYTSEEEAWKGVDTCNNGRTPWNSLPEYASVSGYTKPNMRGSKVTFYPSERVSKFPVPITEE